jgi:hypothetical protein
MWLVLALTLARPVLGKGRQANQVRLKSVFSLGDNDVWKLHPWGAWLNSFDISPDGKTFAAEFEALQEEQKAAIWVGEWDMTAGRLIAEQRVEGPLSFKQLFPSPPSRAQYGFDLRFTPDGRRLVALTGPRIRVLDAEKLELLYSISPGEIYPAPPEGVVIRQYLVSRDSELLAVFSTPGIYLRTPINVRLLSLGSGEKVAEYTLPVSGSADFSLSPDASMVLMSQWRFQQPEAQYVLVVDSRTGESLRSINSGFGTRGGNYGAYAEFLDNDRIVVASRSSSGAPHHALKIIDGHTGRVLQELGYSKHDAQAWFVVATRAPVIAALIFSWKWGIGSDLDAPLQRGVNWLALFHPDQPEPFFVRHNVRLFEHPHSTSLRATMRISSDGKVVAFGESEAIQVYRVEPTAKPKMKSR